MIAKLPKVVTFFCLLVFTSLFFACSTSSEVAGDGWMQKRKYRKGFHLSQLQRKAPQRAAANAQPRMASAVSPGGEGEAEEDFPEPLPENRDDIGAGLNSPVSHQRMEALGESWQKVNPATAKDTEKSKHLPDESLSDSPFAAIPATVQKDTLDAATHAELTAKNKKRLKRGLISTGLSLLAGLLSLIIGYMVVVSAGEVAAMVAIGLVLYSLGVLLLVATSLIFTISLFYVAEALLLKYKSRTLFTPRFYKVMGWFALITSILSMVVVILGGLALGYLFALLLPADIVAAVFFLLVLYIVAVIMTLLYGSTLWLNIIGLWFSIKEDTKGKIAAIVTLMSPFWAFLAFWIGISIG